MVLFLSTGLVLNASLPSIAEVDHSTPMLWTVMESGTTEHLNGIWGSASNHIFAVGDNGTILYYDGTSWSTVASPVSGDIVVRRPRVNAFYGSDLESILCSKEVDTLVLMGVATNWVVEATARYAADADYRVIVLEDCCAGLSVEAHDFSIGNILSRIGEVSNSTGFLEYVR